ncbi:MAG TPA: amidohydrolase [Bacteroidetes bacterium]|nr:amidohydrolase [Bacteroidota bacterium]
MFKLFRNVSFLFYVILISSCGNQRTADTIITDARIWTGNPDQPFAQAMAIKGDVILGVGSNDEILEFRGINTNVEESYGKFITPGFIDTHVHFLQGGMNLASVQLRDAKTPEEFASRIGDFAKTVPAGTWILGGDWDHENWGGELPHRDWIDELTPDHPVFVTRLDGHMSLANSKVLELAGISNDVADVDGGSIVRDSDGRLTGIFKDNAESLIYPHIPEASADEIDRALKAAMNYVASNGVTSVHDMSAELDGIRRTHERGELITRYYGVMPLSRWERVKTMVDEQGKGDEWIQIGGLKGFVDGSLGSHTAAFHEPYTDTQGDSGFFVSTEDDLYTWTKSADEAGLQVMIHAIGDKANGFLLDNFARILEENGPKDRRFRIEHAQHIAPDDIQRFADLEVIASMQPYHAIDDGRWAERVIGPERIKTTYAFKSLLDAGAVVAFGSDWFVAPPTPLEGIYAAVTRQTLDDANPDGWVPEQKVTVEDALTAYTRSAAYASFEEDKKGTLEAGKLADYVVVDRDLIEIDPTEIRFARIMKTVVGGKTVYSRY